MNVVIAAAGTAGHINPGIAIANKIKEEEKNSTITFIGTTRGLENDLVPRAGYKLRTIDAYGLSKKISIENLKKMYKTFKGLGEAKKIIKELKPDIVIGTGGYICGATISAAHSMKIPTMLHESNSFPGRAVRMLAKKTDTILISFEEARGRIPKCNKIVYTGTPVKIKKKKFSKEQVLKIKEDLGIKNEKPIVLIFGGSQGARRINEAVLGIIKNKLNKDYQIVWATGSKQYDVIKEKLEDSNISIKYIENTKILSYIYNMEEVMNIADLIVSRSGAMTITEIANLAKPSILIPLPNVSNDHQMYNAKVLENKKAAIIIKDSELNTVDLNNKIHEIVLDENRKLQMGKNAFTVSANNVEDKIWKEIKELIENKKINNR